MLRFFISRLPTGGSRIGVQTNVFRQCSQDISERVNNLIKKDKVVVFMKGTPIKHRCGFSVRATRLLNLHGVDFQYYNVLEDLELRKGVKEFTKWPTLPQIFFDGFFVGGWDILKQKHLSGELVTDLEKIGIKSTYVKGSDDEQLFD